MSPRWQNEPLKAGRPDALSCNAPEGNTRTGVPEKIVPELDGAEKRLIKKLIKWINL
jgi:hypothetical protein